MSVEFRAVRQYDEAKMVVHESHYPNFEARLAVSLLEKWGMVAAESDGEDSAGRQKLRLATPRELAVRACEVAREVTSEMHKRDWLLPTPTWDELRTEAATEKKREREELKKN